VSRPFRVCVEARVEPRAQGGVAQVVMGLASGLGTLADDGAEYLFLGNAGTREWLSPYLGPNSRIVLPPGRTASYLRRSLRDPLRAWQGLPLAARLLGPRVTASDGFVEAQGAAVVHFPYQYGFRTRIPTVYHPHDLQHVHLPENFSPAERRNRERIYGALCRASTMVATASSWVRDDVIAHFRLPPGKVAVVPLAPATLASRRPTEAELEETARRFSLPGTFAFYPARTWTHKNHAALVEAVARLRASERLDVPLVFTDDRGPCSAQLARRAEVLGVGDLVRFVGHVTQLQLECLYRLARVVVVPSRFEAASFPLWEAQLAGVPVACSNVTSLPRQASGAALLFDPGDVDQVAAAVRRLWTDAGLREDLARRGSASVARFTWERTARTFRAHYRRLGGRPLDAEDRALLEAPPLL
jgi:glycosyltransferase involved in cell wall biosynthesis